MPELTLNPLADLERIIDSRVQRGDFTADEVASLLNAVRRAHAVIAGAAANPNLSPAAQTVAAEQAVAAAEREIADFEIGTKRLAERVEADEARALGTPKVDDSRAAEIRAWASGKSASERAAIYFRAIDSEDCETVAAFETAPRSFGLLDDVSPERARTRKLATLPAELRAELDAARRRIAGYGHVTDASRRTLRLMLGGR